MLAGHSYQATLEPLRTVFSGGAQLLAPAGTDIAVSGKPTAALLAVLCLAPGVAVDRDQPSELLWRGKLSAHARASLRRLGQGADFRQQRHWNST